MVARSVTDVVLGEATSGTKAQRLADMKAIYSAIANRAALTGLTPQQIVANSREFNAYGRALPKGVGAYRDLAEQAIREVQTKGPVHTGTFYATPKAAKNLPSGLQHVTSTSGHRYYSDPQNRSIGTALGYRQPTQKTGAQAAIDVAMASAPRSVPTPSFAQRPMPTLSSALAGQPQTSVAVSAAGSLPSSLSAQAIRGGRIGLNTTTGVPTPSARPTQVMQSASRAAPDASRFGPSLPAQMPAAMLDRYADSRPTQTAGRLSDRVAPQSVTAGLGQPLSGVKAQNVADRLGTFEPTRSAASLRTAPASPFSLGSVVGISPAAAATTPTAAPRTTAQAVTPAMTAPTVPTRTNFAGQVGSPRALEGRLNASLASVNPMVSQAPVRSAPVAAPTITTPTVTASPSIAAPTNFAGRIGSPRSVEASLPAGALGGISAPSRVAVPTAAPRTAAMTAAPAQVSVPSSRPTINAPQARVASQAPQARVAMPTARPAVSDPWSGMQQAPQAVATPAPSATVQPGLMSRLGLTPGRIAGGLIGSAVAGPIGGLVGGYLGGRLSGPQAAAPAAGGASIGFGGLGGLGGMNSSSGGYGRNDTRSGGFGNAGGYSDRSGSFAGFGERDSAVGLDGGKVGGSSSSRSSSSSKSSSSSGGKSSGGGKGKK